MLSDGVGDIAAEDCPLFYANIAGGWPCAMRAWLVGNASVECVGVHVVRGPSDFVRGRRPHREEGLESLGFLFQASNLLPGVWAGGGWVWDDACYFSLGAVAARRKGPVALGLS